MLRFWEDFYLPEMSRRFGRAAIMESQDAFLSDSRDCFKLDLLSEGRVVASNLLHPSNGRLAIVKGARNPECLSLRGQMDSLDYFALLLAQVGGYKTLDFGLSRANLNDGPLLYKAKWGAQAVPDSGLKADIRIGINRLTAATRSILRQNRFLERDGSAFALRVLGSNDMQSKEMSQLIRRAESIGIARIDLLGADKEAADLFASQNRIRVNAVPFEIG